MQLCGQRQFVLVNTKISRSVYNLLSQADDSRSLRELLDAQDVPRGILLAEIEELWSKRLVVINVDHKVKDR